MLSLKKYRSQFQIRIKPSVPKSELAAAIAEHFATIPVPDETEVINKFFKALQKNRTTQSETEESADEPPTITKKSAPSDLKKKFKDPQEKDKNSIEASSDSNHSELSKNSTQSNLKKNAKRNSIPKVESKLLLCTQVSLYLMDFQYIYCRITISNCSLTLDPLFYL